MINLNSLRNSRMVVMAQILVVCGASVFVGLGHDLSTAAWIFTLATLAIVEAVFSSGKSWLWLSCGALLATVVFNGRESLFSIFIAEGILLIQLFGFLKSQANKTEYKKAESAALAATSGLIFLSATLSDVRDLSVAFFILAVFARLLEWPLNSFCHETAEREKQESLSYVWAIKSLIPCALLIKPTIQTNSVGAVVLALVGSLGMIAVEKKGSLIALIFAMVLYKPALGIYLAPAMILSFGGAVSQIALYVLCLLLPSALGQVFDYELQIVGLVVLGIYFGAMNSASKLPEKNFKDKKDIVSAVLAVAVIVFIITATEDGLLLQNMMFESLALLATALVTEAVFRVFVKKQWQERLQPKKDSLQVLSLAPAFRAEEYHPFMKTNEKTVVSFCLSRGLHKSAIENYFALAGITAGIMWFVVFWLLSNS